MDLLPFVSNHPYLVAAAVGLAGMIVYTEVRQLTRRFTELGLVQGTPDRGRGDVGVVSSEGTDLERSTAYRAYSARYQEGRRYLEGRKQT